MKIKTPTEFLTFNDGQVKICTVKNNRIQDCVKTLCYGNEVLHRKSGKYEHRQGHPRPPVAGHDETGRCHQQRSIQNRTGTAFEGYEPSCYCSVSSRNWSDQRWLRLSKQMNWPENFR